MAVSDLAFDPARKGSKVRVTHAEALRLLALLRRLSRPHRPEPQGRRRTRASRSTSCRARTSRCASRIAPRTRKCACRRWRREQGLLTQSLAILVWLEQTYPEPRLVPADPWLGAQVRAFALTIATDIHPLNNTSVLTRIKLEFSADDDHVGEWYRHWIKLGFNALEHQAAAARRKPSTPSATNPRSPTSASCRKWPTRAASRPISRHSRASSRGTKHARQHPAFIKAAPENQKDAVKA